MNRLMFVLFVVSAVSVSLVFGCGGASGTSREGSTPVKAENNPLLMPFDAPFGVPPFEKITVEHYVPAFDVALEKHQAEIDTIVANTEEATFENTVAALDYSGALLTSVANVFFSINSAETNDEIQAIAKEMAPRLSTHSDGIMMNEELFSKINAVHEKREELSLSKEEARLLKETYKEFVRGGAKLAADNKKRLAEINKKLSLLKLRFGENLLAENNEFKVVVEDKKELAGLPSSAIEGAADAAKEAGLEGSWVFTLHKPSWIPFLQFSKIRELREKMFKGYIERGNHGDKNDNKSALVEMSELRSERAKMFGFKTHAHYVLEDNMAKSPDKVYELLNKLWEAAKPITKAEAEELQESIKKDGNSFDLEPWDWWYYTEKLRKEKYDLSDAELRPYFKLEDVQQGAFDVASKLFGLKFKNRDDLPVYHSDVKTVEVLEADDKHVGILYLDYFPRPGKRQGAWMTAYRSQKVKDGEFITPVVANVFNFSKPTKTTPALISFEEVETLFHEFGHGLHGLLSNVTYPGLAGTSVSRDFVELPSQFMENWAVEKSVLKTYAKHYETGEVIPDELIEKIIKARHFNQGFQTTEYLAASFLDLDWHTLEQMPKDVNVVEFEKAALDKLGLIPEVVSRYRSTYFAHIFAGGYSSGYYSYIWAAVLDSDAFAAFKEKDELFDPATAKAYRDNILSSGNTADPLELYIEFRGAEPKIEPLLIKRGLASE